MNDAINTHTKHTGTRSLGIIGQLPGFQGNVPVQLIERSQDSNITAAAGTGWMNSVDPLYANISDTWMKTLINDFGTVRFHFSLSLSLSLFEDALSNNRLTIYKQQQDHWYQLDGYFNGTYTSHTLNNDNQHTQTTNRRYCTLASR